MSHQLPSGRRVHTIDTSAPVRIPATTTAKVVVRGRVVVGMLTVAAVWSAILIGLAR